MPTTFVKGDIFEDPGQGEGKRAFAFAAGTNGALDLGIAVTFAKRHPELVAAVKERAASGEIPMGDVITWASKDTTIYVLALLRRGKPAKISNVTLALEQMVTQASAAGVTRIAIPRIGGGKTELDWSRVKRVLAEVGDKTSIELVVYQQFIRGVAATVATDEAPEDE